MGNLFLDWKPLSHSKACINYVKLRSIRFFFQNIYKLKYIAFVDFNLIINYTPPKVHDAKWHIKVKHYLVLNSIYLLLLAGENLLMSTDCCKINCRKSENRSLSALKELTSLATNAVKSVA